MNDKRTPRHGFAAKHIPLILAVVFFLIISFGLASVLRENLRVAPRRDTAENGRLYAHMKNTTRFSGTLETVRSDIRRAVLLEDSPQPGDETTPWQDVITGAISVSEPVRHVVVLPSEGGSALAWSLPGAYWAIYSGSPVVFAGTDSLDAGALARIREYGAPAFVAAPESLLSDRALGQIRAVVQARRVAKGSLAAQAVHLAEFRDPDSGFGWGRTHDSRNGYFEYVVTTPRESGYALAAFPLSKSNAAALLYASDDGSLPGVTDRYLWKQRADFYVTPAEGPFRHLWVVGNRISYASQARMDHALEKGPYPSYGTTAFGPMEGLLVVFMAWGIASGIFVLVHSTRALPHVPLGMRIAWISTATLVPVLGILLYFAAYRRPQPASSSPHPEFIRPPSIQSAAATVMGFGYGAPVMIVIAFLFLYFGLPLFYGEWAEGWRFLFGAGMPIMMFVMWAGAILLAWPLAQFPMHLALMPGMKRRKLLKRTFVITAVSMTAVSLGMMTTAWWMQMYKLPMMPGEDEILFFGAMWLASFIGFLIAWPLNYPLVRTGLKMGGV